MWRIVTKVTIYGETIPNGLRDDRGFVCQFLAPTHWTGQDARYTEECALLRKHAEIMCAALNRSEAERLPTSGTCSGSREVERWQTLTTP